MSVSKNLKFLENYLSERTYIEGNRPSQADILVLNTLRSAPTKATPNVYRWYTHIQSYSDRKKNKFAEKSLNNEIAKFLNKSAAATTDDSIESGKEDGEAERNEDGRLKADSVKDQRKRLGLLITIPLDEDYGASDAPAVESHVRSVKMPGLVLGDAKVVPVKYELRISSVIEDHEFDNDYLIELQSKILSTRLFNAMGMETFDVV